MGSDYDTRLEVTVRYITPDVTAERKHVIKQMWLGGPEEDWVEQAVYLARKATIEIVRAVTGNMRWLPNK